MFNVNMSECIKPLPDDYETFCDFFTRKLKNGIHKIDNKKNSIISSCDGKILEFGKIKDNTIVQVKGKTTNINSLLNDDMNLSSKYQNGSYAVIYLAPHDYHRVHMPYHGKLTKTIHIPGRLYSVASHAVKCIKNLYIRNERLVCSFEENNLMFSVIFVGAINVSSIEVVWKGESSPPLPKKTINTDYRKKKIDLKKGQELGMFKTGSTVILLFNKKVELLDSLKKGKKIRVGSQIAKIIS
ncbi:MAG: archaetidylserine decarboxylase [Pseudomonadota bacterium]|nr:archaetidylserine decarboxylase [Pseudomonadota bacterium]